MANGLSALSGLTQGAADVYVSSQANKRRLREAEEKRKREREREQKITDLVNLAESRFQGPGLQSPESASAELRGMGVNVPVKMNWTPAFDAMDLPKDHWLRILSPDMTDQMVNNYVYQLDATFGKTDRQVDALIEGGAWANTPMATEKHPKGDPVKIKAMIEAQKVVGKAQLPSLYPFLDTETNPFELIDNIMFDVDGNRKDYSQILPEDRLKLYTITGINEKGLKSALDISDEDTPMDMILKARMDIFKESTKFAMTLKMVEALGDPAKLEAVFEDISVATMKMIPFLTEGKLPEDQEALYSELKAIGLFEKSKQEAREFIEAQREAGIAGYVNMSDNQIDYLLQNHYGRLK